jgi:hypothetical protein
MLFSDIKTKHKIMLWFNAQNLRCLSLAVHEVTTENFRVNLFGYLTLKGSITYYSVIVGQSPRITISKTRRPQLLCASINKMYRRSILWSRGVHPRILQDDTRWSCAVNFQVRQLTPRKLNGGTYWIWGMVWGWEGRDWTEERFSVYLGIMKHVLPAVARPAFTMCFIDFRVN